MLRVKTNNEDQFKMQQKLLSECMSIIAKVKQSREKIERETVEIQLMSDKHAENARLVHSL